MSQDHPGAKVLSFANKVKELAQSQERSRNAEALKLIEISDEIDSVIVKYLQHGDIDPRDLAGLLAHRLGTLMRHLEHKSKLWDVCEQVLKKQAAID